MMINISADKLLFDGNWRRDISRSGTYYRWDDNALTLQRYKKNTTAE